MKFVVYHSGFEVAQREGLSPWRRHISGIEPITSPVGFTVDELEAARIEHPVPTMTWGPATTEEVRAFRLHHQGWP